MITEMKVRDLLLSIDSMSVYHYVAPPDAVAPYTVWAGESSRSEYADDKPYVRDIQGTIDYYTYDEYDEMPNEIEDTFASAYIPLVKNNVLYNEESGIIHHEWVWTTWRD